MPHLSRLLRAPKRVCLAVALAVALLHVATASAGGFLHSAHGDLGQLPRGCGSCHVGHGPPGTTMMAAHQEETCLACHGDSAARGDAVRRRLMTSNRSQPDVRADFQKLSRHPLSGMSGAPRRSRFESSGRQGAAGAVSSVTCTDCHDAHYVVKSVRKVSQSARSVKRIDNARGRSTTEYALCYRCHGSSHKSVRGLADIQRLTSAANRSYHPVEAVGRNRDVPSLIRPMTEQSIIACTDCHGGDQAGGARGPHGSMYAPILKANFGAQDGLAESAYRYALCYRCHSRSTLLSPSSFPKHRSHVVDERASCHTCHDSHGSARNSHLIRFDTDVVRPNSKGQLRYEELGNRRGSCSLSCHGEDHDNQTYPN
ncbi:hypothetical protein HQ560_18010 [bacterium]|nr:hypothetical protein [bacterium]